MISYSKWYEKIKIHLSNYKKNELKIEKDGIWVGNKKRYGHILPKENAESNYLSDISRNALPKKERHKYWYHLNSSQTLCVNFFAPLIGVENGKYLNELLSKIVGKKVIFLKTDKSPKFEHVPRKHSTNFDFYFKDTNTNEYFFEIKYTEAGISESGGGSNPSNAFKEYYEEDVQNNPIFKNVSKDMFMNKHFQAYRNMVKGVGGNYSIFITMKNNKATYDELQKALADLKVKETPNIIILYWEELIETTLDIVKANKSLEDYYKNFKKKYIPEIY